MRHDAGHRGAHEIPVAVVLLVGHPVGPLAEAAEVGREHDVALAREHVRVRRAFVVLLVERGRRCAPCPGPWPWIASTAGPGSVRSCGTRRYAGTDIVASVSNTTRSRRYVPQSTLSVVSRSSGTGSGAGRAARAADRARAAPRLEPAGEVVERARVGVDRGLVMEPPVRPVGEVATPCSRRWRSRRRRRAPSRGRPRDGAGTPASPTRPGSGRGSSRTRVRGPPRSTTRADSRTSAVARRAP